MTSDENDTPVDPAVDAFIAELKHWRELAGKSQKALGALVSYDASYVNKVERGSVIASQAFAEQADRHLNAGRALVRAWRSMRDALGNEISDPRARDRVVTEEPSIAEAELIVEHEHAELVYDGGVFRTRIRRLLRNVGTQPVTQYPIRIAVDRHPGDPDRSNQLYRESPLTWDEIGLSAAAGDEPMTWRPKHDRDAFKEVWLLFENRDGHFPLYPGETIWLEYVYTVGAEKWGSWWQRAIRLPTRRLSMSLVLPTDLEPAVWGLETSMTAEASPPDSHRPSPGG